MSKTLNLSTVEEKALIQLLKQQDKIISGYSKDYKTARRVALSLIRGLLVKLGEKVSEDYEL